MYNGERLTLYIAFFFKKNQFVTIHRVGVRCNGHADDTHDDMPPRNGTQERPGKTRPTLVTSVSGLTDGHVHILSRRSTPRISLTLPFPVDPL